MRSRACWALRIVMTVNGARGGEGGGEGGDGGGGGSAGGEGGLGGCSAASTTRLTRTFGGALHARICEASLDPPRYCVDGIQIQPLLPTPLTQLWTLAVTSISNQPARFESAVAIAGVRYSALRPSAPTKVRNVAELAFHSFEISCSWAVSPGALAENVRSTLYRSVARWICSCGRSWFGPDLMMSGELHEYRVVVAVGALPVPPQARVLGADVVGVVRADPRRLAAARVARVLAVECV
jgi:hypothetical protein